MACTLLDYNWDFSHGSALNCENGQNDLISYKSLSELFRMINDSDSRDLLKKGLMENIANQNERHSVVLIKSYLIHAVLRIFRDPRWNY